MSSAAGKDEVSDREEHLSLSSEESDDAVSAPQSAEAGDNVFTFGGQPLAPERDVTKELASLRADYDVSEREANARKNIYVKGLESQKELRSDKVELDYDPSAYDFYHQFTVDWPMLSIDVILDCYGINRTEFPHRFAIVGGSQTDAAVQRASEISILSCTEISSTRLGEDDTESTDPLYTIRKIDVPATINRIKSFSALLNNTYLTGHSGIVAAWSEDGVFSIHNISSHLRSLGIASNVSQSFSRTSGAEAADYNFESTSFSASVGAWCGYKIMPPSSSSISRHVNLSGADSKLLAHKTNGAGPRSNAARHVVLPSCLFADDNNSVEGYAIGMSTTRAIAVSGDVEGRMKAYQIRPDGSIAVDSSIASSHRSSVEDIQFAKTGQAFASSCFASCSSDQSIIIADPRMKSGKQLRFRAHNADVNVIDWSYGDENILVSGADDGSIKLWDLRNTESSTNTYSFHTGPITSLRFSPTDPTTFAAASDDGQCSIWDYDVAGDDTEAEALEDYTQTAQKTISNLPKELIFIHMNLDEPRELVFHPQIPGSLVITDAAGLQFIKPINVGFEYDDIADASDVEGSEHDQ